METSNTKKNNRKLLKSLKPVCGDCVGFECERLVSSKQNCKDMGLIATSETCGNFQPNLRNVEAVVAEEGAFIGLSRIVNELGDNSLRTLGSLLMMEGTTRQAGFRLGQIVYVRYRGAAGANYLSNFMKAHIMFVSATHYRLMSKDGKCVLTFSRECAPHILSMREFAALRKDMLAKGRMVDPDVKSSLSRRLRAEEDYELGLTKESMSGSVTTIDKVFRENKVKRNKGLNDLVSIVAEIEKGMCFKKNQQDSYVSKSNKKKPSSKVKRSRSGDVTVEV